MKLLATALFFSMTCLVYGCNTNNSSSEEGTDTTTKETPIQEEDMDTAHKKLMLINPETFETGTIRNARLTVRNYTSQPINFDSRFTIEQQRNGGWEKLDVLDEVVFTDALYSIKPGNTKELPVVLNSGNYEYEAGLYRLCKEMEINGSVGTSCVEFRVN